MGSPDLDLRPPQMKRSTMRAWIQECPHCHYLAPELSLPVASKTALDSAAYEALRVEARFPELARKFLGYALLTVESNPIQAGYARLRAAWDCDDARLAESATACRNAAAECFMRLKPFEDNEPGAATALVLIDVLRRAGNFEQAAGECGELWPSQNVAEVMRDVLKYQRVLITQRDDAAYRIEDAIRAAS